MKHDLFHSNDGRSAVHPDVVLITSYLSRELSAAEIAGVEDRLESDVAFRERVQPIIELWTVRGSLAHGRVAPTTVPRSSLTGADIEQGWQRYVAGRTDPRARSRRVPPPANPSSAKPRRVSVSRIAAMIAVVVLPMLGVAQLVRYAANNIRAPGHEVARAIVHPVLRPSDALEGQALPIAKESSQQGVPLAELTTPAARTNRTFTAILGLKETSHGLLVNDPVMKRVYLLDTALAVTSVPLDTVPGSAQSYGFNDNIIRVRLVPYLGDSALLSASDVRGLRVLDGRGRVIRALDASFAFADEVRNRGGIDPQGRVLVSLPAEILPGRPDIPVRTFSVRPSAFLPQPAKPPAWTGSSRGGSDPGADGFASVRIPTRPDTVPIERIDLDARRVDTIGWYNLPIKHSSSPFLAAFGGGRIVIGLGADGKGESIRQVINPVELADVWTVLSDGTVAIVRAHDYHVDWIRPDGRRTSSSKLPFEMQRLGDTDKQRLVDSTRACLDSADAWIAAVSYARLAAQARRDFEAANRVPSGGDIPPHPACMPPLPRDALGQPFITMREFAPRMVRYDIVPLADIPDYYPPFRESAALADADGNLWILPRITKLSRKGELVYDVVNPDRGLVRRVRLPAGRSIAGFGKQAVYLQIGNLSEGFSLERYALPK